MDSSSLQEELDAITSRGSASCVRQVSELKREERTKYLNQIRTDWLKSLMAEWLEQVSQ